MLITTCDCSEAPDAGAEVGAAASSSAPAHEGSTAKPFDLEIVSISRRKYVDLKLHARQYRSLHARAVKRLKWMRLCHDRELAQAREQLAAVQAELALARAQNRDLRQRVFDAKTEQSRSVNALVADMAPDEAPRRPPGHQRERRGHGRSRLPLLPSVVQELPCATTCRRWGAATVTAWGSEDAEVLAVDVRVYRRIARRQRCRSACGCNCLRGLATTPAPDALWSRSKLGVSIWVELLLSKFLYGQPTARMLLDWTERGLPIAQGTVTQGLQRLAPLFKPMLDACLAEVRRTAHWHADETRWEVFEDLPGKTGHRWYLWVFETERAVCFVLGTPRSAAVPTHTLSGADGGILSVNCYAAYRKFAHGVPGSPSSTPFKACGRGSSVATTTWRRLSTRICRDTTFRLNPLIGLWPPVQCGHVREDHALGRAGIRQARRSLSGRVRRAAPARRRGQASPVSYLVWKRLDASWAWLHALWWRGQRRRIPWSRFAVLVDRYIPRAWLRSYPHQRFAL